MYSAYSNEIIQQKLIHHNIHLQIGSSSGHKAGSSHTSIAKFSCRRHHIHILIYGIAFSKNAEVVVKRIKKSDPMK
jgi:hypothetical protein